MDTHMSTGGVLVMVVAGVILAITAVWYQVMKRQIARHKAERAARALETHAAE